MAASRQFYPALDAATEAALRESIERFGVLVPPTVDQNGEVIDGHHRLRIADELGVECAPVMRHIADEDEAREIARTLNEDRRMLTREQRLAVVEALREEGHSIRAIAGALGVSKGAIQNDVARVLASTPDETTGLDGKKYPSAKPKPDTNGRKKRPEYTLDSNKGNQVAQAEIRRLNSTMAALDGYREGMNNMRLGLAIDAATLDERKAWERSASEFISTLRAITRALKEARHSAQ